MSDKAIFILPKNEEQLTLVHVINMFDFDSNEIKTKNINGIIHHVGKLLRRVKVLGQKDKIVIVATSYDSFLIDALIRAKIKFRYLEDLTYIGEAYTKRAYASISE